MKKTDRSPENTEVTPSKKKLKQARLPFMLVSDVSPKPGNTPSRKRKLSVPEPEPVTKIGKLSEKSKDSDDLVVISDEDSKGVQSPRKEEKPRNPYVKLVDAARKKKIQKSKAQKKGRTRSSKKQTKDANETKTSEENADKSENDEVEMVEVDVIIHEEAEQDSETLTNGPTTPHIPKDVSENNNKSANKKVTSKQQVNVVDEKNTATTEKKDDKGSEVICLEDSNNSSDVQMAKNAVPDFNKQTEISKDLTQQTSKQVKKKADSVEPIRKLFPKRSVKNEINKSVQKISQSPSSMKNMDKEHSKKSKNSQNYEKHESPTLEDKTKTEKSIETNDSDVEMIDLEDQPAKSPIKSLSKVPLEKTHSNDILEHSSEEMDSSKTEEQLTTPKRSTRIKDRTEKTNSLDMSTTSSKLDESMVSNPSTPKHKDGDKSLNESIKSANLTPKQLQKKLESEKKKEEREKEKLEREKKRQQEKEERAKQRQEKENQKKREREEKEEIKRKEREEKEEQRKKEKEEKERLKEMERKARELKEEQKRKEKEDKEEQRKKEKEARDEEKKKRQEALELEKQEQELKKKKAAEAFANFFVPKQKVEREASVGPVSKSSMLSSFAIKSDMRLAPTTRTILTDEQREILDRFLQEQSDEDLYLKCLKNGTKPLSSGKTWPLDDKDNDVILVEDELPPIDGAGEVISCESAPRENLRPKLLSFHENRRPPYWGTWRKKSKFVTPRRPFGQEKQLDYEVDSDDDWEDEADGESLDGSAGGSDDEAGADDYEVDNEVFVPHGYLSDEEATMDEDDVLSLSPETQKARLKHLEDEFESELKKPTEKLKPRLYGLLWESPDCGKPEKCVDALWNYFEKFAMIMNDPTPLLQPSSEPEETEKKKIKKKKVLAEVNELSPKSEKKKKSENKESKKTKSDAKKALPNQPGINTFLKKVNST